MKLFLLKHFDFTKKECDLFISNAKLVNLKKKHVLLRADGPVKKLFFIENGLVRGYRLNNGIDVTHHFFVEKNFATDYESYLTKKDGELYLEALTDVIAYEFDNNQQNEDYYQYLAWGALFGTNTWSQATGPNGYIDPFGNGEAIIIANHHEDTNGPTANGTPCP